MKAPSVRLGSVAGLALAVLLAAPEAAGAAAVDVFLGGSYAKSDDLDLYGWNGDAVFYLRDRVGLVFGVDGLYGNTAGEDVTQASLLGGVHGRLSHTAALTPFAHVLAGATRTSRSIQLFDITLAERDTDFTIVAGGGFDWRPGSGRWALRLGADYRRIQAEAGAVSGPRIGAGVVVRFGP